MYTMEERECEYEVDILDPDGDVICTVQNKWQAKSLLSHLNRGM